MNVRTTPPPWPTPGGIPPPCKPPECFDILSKIEWCYDNSNSWYQFVEQVVVDVLKTVDPGAFQWPVLGVTDGSLGSAPGYVGELRTQQFTGAFTNVASAGTSYGSLFAASVPAGCWELSYQLQVFGGQVLTAYCRLDSQQPSVPTNIPGNLQAYAIATAGSFSGPQPMTTLPVICPPTPFATATPALLIFRVNAYSGVGTTVPSAPYQFNGYARRVR